MKEITKEDVKQEVFDLYDDYAHNRIERREFMQKTFCLCGWAVLPLQRCSGFLMPAYASSIHG